MSCLMDPSKGIERLWFCLTSECLQLDNVPHAEQDKVKPKQDGWPKFRERNDIGDTWADLSNPIYQKAEINKALGDMATKPSGVAILTGKPGTGKTYAAMRVMEFYLRRNGDVAYFTGAGLKTKWLEATRSGEGHKLESKCKNYRLLVIDDFGQKEPTPGYMEFVFDVISHRLQWSDRGTVITSNLQPKEFLTACGEALADRLRVQRWLKFEGKSRR